MLMIFKPLPYFSRVAVIRGQVVTMSGRGLVGVRITRSVRRMMSVLSHHESLQVGSSQRGIHHDQRRRMV